MSIFSRRKRLLNRTRLPKMSSRRQFHRALRRHPAWPAVMAEAAARAQTQKAIQHDRVSNRTGLRRLAFALPAAPSFKGLLAGKALAAWRRSKVRRSIRRNRVLVVTLLVVGGLVALLTGISLARGEWDISNTVWGDGGSLPNGRWAVAVTFDSTNKEIITFGGFVASNELGVGGVYGPPIDTKGETYAYKTNRWHNRNPIHSPPPRGYAAMAYDAARSQAVLFGGGQYKTNDVLGDTWTWDGTDWSQQNPPEPLPPARQGHAMAYDAHRRVVVMYGGRDAQGKPLDDTWTWDGSKWDRKPSEGAPRARYGHAMAYDVCNAKSVIFGGIGNADPVTGLHTETVETWTWNGNAWNQESPATPPTGRVGASLVYSPASGRVVMYGGLAVNEAGVPTAAADEDVWRWDGAAEGTSPDKGRQGWEKMASETGAASNAVLAIAGGDGKFRAPTVPPRGYPVFSYYYDGGTGGSVFYLFGGTPSETSQFAYSDEVRFWEAGIVNIDQPQSLVGDTPLTRRCTNPVPLPDAGAAPVEEVEEEEPENAVRKGMEEVAQLPVLLGTNWLADQRDTHLYGNPPRPNPKYTPPPDCPSRKSEDGSQTFLFTDQKRNRVYQFFACDEDRGYDERFQAKPKIANTLIQVHDGTDLAVLARWLVPYADVSPYASPALFHDNRLFHDVDRGRFVLSSEYYDYVKGRAVNELLEIRQDLLERGVDPVVRRIDVAGAPSTVANSLRETLGTNWFNHPKSGRIKFYYTYTVCEDRVPNGAVLSLDQTLEQQAGSCKLRLAQYDVEDQREDWYVPFVVPQCTGQIETTRLFRNGDWIYASCMLDTAFDAYRAVVRLPVQADPNDPNSDRPKIDSSGNAVVEVYPGYSRGGIRWNDPKGERVLLLDSVYQGTVGNRVWVFDSKAARYVGLTSGIGHTYYIQYGFDPETGRFYAQFPDNRYSTSVTGKEPGGLVLADTRLTPVAQGMRFPQFKAFPMIPITTLAATPGAPRRIFTRYGAGRMSTYPDGTPVKYENEMFYRVLADEVPIPGKPGIAELDKLTLGIPESPGKTEAFYDAEGSSYGMRLRSVGGVWSVLRAPPSLNAANAGEGVWFGDLMSPLPPNCLFPDREVMAGWVQAARLSDIDAVARSSGLDVDSNSKVDLEGPLSRCLPDANPATLHPAGRAVYQTLWPLSQMAQNEGNEAAAEQLSWDKHFKEVECVGDALTTHQATVGNVYGSANCVKRNGLVEATARGSATGGGPIGTAASQAGFSVGEGYSNVTVSRDAVKGVVVTSTAVAKGIQLPNLTIGMVKTEAVAWSNGRPGDGRTSFTRTICRVTTPNFEHEKECLTEAEQNELVGRWNSGWGKNSKMYLPTPDPEYFRGSPGGYIVGVIKPLGENVEDQLISRDFQREVPGLVIVFFKDSQYTGSDRQVLLLAATRAVAGLGVQCNTDLTFSSSAKACVEPAIEADPVEEFFEEEEAFEESAFSSYDDGSGGWIPIEATGAPSELALGTRLGRFIENLPVLRRLPIRQMGEALLAASVWLLLGMPLFLASRRFALNLARRN